MWRQEDFVLLRKELEEAEAYGHLLVESVESAEAQLLRKLQRLSGLHKNCVPGAASWYESLGTSSRRELTTKLTALIRDTCTLLSRRRHVVAMVLSLLCFMPG